MASRTYSVTSSSVVTVKELGSDPQASKKPTGPKKGLGIVVHEAWYGVMGREVNVKEIVQARCPAGVTPVSFKVDNGTMNGDPVPFVVKRLRVVYSVNGGAPKSSEAAENSQIHLGNDGIFIHEAWYGVPGREINVTDIVQSRCPPGAVTMVLRVDNGTMGGDPAGGVVKRLRVVYEVNFGRMTTAEAREGSDFRI